VVTNDACAWGSYVNGENVASLGRYGADKESTKIFNRFYIQNLFRLMHFDPVMQYRIRLPDPVIWSVYRGREFGISELKKTLFKTTCQSKN